MDITWYGQTCFRLNERRRASVVTDPYPPELGLNLPHPRAQIVTSSTNDPQHKYLSGVKGPYKLLDAPGEYEVGGVFITGVPTFADSVKGAERGLNTIFMFDYDGLVVCHLGHLGHVPTQSQVEDLGTVDILLVPVGSAGSLTPAQASEVISLFEPRVVIPMLYAVPHLQTKLDTLSLFLKQMGAERVESTGVFKAVKSKMAEETQVVVLQPKQLAGE